MTTWEWVRRPARALVVSTCVLVAVSGATVVTTTGAQAQPAAPQQLEATLRPSGDPNGAGHATFTLNRARHRVCATVTWRRIGAPNAAHIHRHLDGAIVVDLTGSVTGGARCARGVPGPLIGRILSHPRRYYFNVHNTAHPSGAIQGTLHR
jgi:hypothetical protein